MKEPYAVERYRPTSMRRRVLIVLLALATAVSLLLYMVGRRGDIIRGNETWLVDVPTCKNGKTEGCVGGTVTVIALPPPAAAASANRVP